MNFKTFYRNVYRVVYGKFHPIEYAKKIGVNINGNIRLYGNLRCK